MLIEFRVENHRSIREEQVISFEASGAPDERVRVVPGCAKGLLPAVGIYGANASGKSNVLAALAFMRHAVDLSHRYWAPDKGVPRDPFAWGEPRPSLYELTFLVDGTQFQYGFTADNEQILEEWLSARPSGRAQTWFTRDKDVFSFGAHLKHRPASFRQFVRANALYLSTAAQLGHPQLLPIFEAITQINVLGAGAGSSVAAIVQATTDAFGPEHALEAWRRLLKEADLGITDLRLDPVAGLELEHSSGRWLPLAQESHGTQNLAFITPTLGATLLRGGIIVVDELEAGLHPTLALFLLRQFNDPKTNPHNAQLLFTTHDTHLLGTTLGDPPLRRDQVWLTEKDAEGATHLYPLTDYQPRKAENLERGYLQGRYGAIPILGELPPPEAAK